MNIVDEIERDCKGARVRYIPKQKMALLIKKGGIVVCKAIGLGKADALQKLRRVVNERFG